ncbi:hypothetical protein Acr_15g0016250 [Actinidia rufa]|uniref:Uncharacterized protein n=1 Tax=Actinidia rufa TaxID=165716 RepID=A0A7J0FX20_9ERIC|nr:hypothetical protein Acr_15g0016250 [Actinidia rufa]
MICTVPKSVLIFFQAFLTLLSCSILSSLHAHARDGQFFDKVTTPATANPKETVEVPNKEPPLSKQEQDPNFIPDTQNGYGLYGQESDQLTPTTPTNLPSTASNLPYKTESEKAYYYYDKQAYVTKPQGMSDTRFMDRGYTNNNNYYNSNNKQAYVTNPQGMSDTRFMDRGYTTNNNYNNNNNQAYVTNPQGMSDTRFMDRGYTTTTPTTTTTNNNNNNYYIKKGYTARHCHRQLLQWCQQLQSPTSRHEYGSSQGVDNYNKGYYGNSYNENSYVENNSMEGYQNQEQFQEDQEEFVP